MHPGAKLNFQFYSLYHIEIVLSFSKIPSMLQSESVHKRYHIFRKYNFPFVGIESTRPGADFSFPILVGNRKVRSYSDFMSAFKGTTMH
jgi:hypothetical protein